MTIVLKNPWGLAHLEDFRSAAQAANSEIVKEILLPKFDNNDIQRELSLIKPLNLDAILIAANFSDSSTFAKKRVELGISAKVLAEQKFEDLFNGGQISADLLKDVTVFKFSDADQDFIKKYQKEYGELPKQYADTAYDAVYVFKKALENANGSYTAQDIMAGIHKIKEYRGASGIMNFNSQNYPTNKSSVLKVFKNNKFVELK